MNKLDQKTMRELDMMYLVREYHWTFTEYLNQPYEYTSKLSTYLRIQAEKENGESK